jgi:hypothetical protein
MPVNCLSEGQQHGLQIPNTPVPTLQAVCGWFHHLPLDPMAGLHQTAPSCPDDLDPLGTMHPLPLPLCAPSPESDLQAPRLHWETNLPLNNKWGQDALCLSG